MSDDHIDDKRRARAWFEELQGKLLAALEALEADAPGPFARDDIAPGKAEVKPWRRSNHDGADGGGGRMGTLKGRVFEKAGVHSSTVYGTFAPEFAKQIPGASADPRFWASGISVIVHPWNPNVPGGAYEHALRRHLEELVRRRRRPDAGARPPPHPGGRRHAGVPRRHARRLRGQCRHRRLCALQGLVRGVFFPEAPQRAARHRRHLLRLPGARRLRPRVRSIFAFTRAVGEAFLAIYPELVCRNYATPWSEADREEQLVRRGRYVEFNLIYDRGTIFGLKTGGNVESILSSLPPAVRWP